MNHFQKQPFPLLEIPSLARLPVESFYKATLLLLNMNQSLNALLVACIKQNYEIVDILLQSETLKLSAFAAVRIDLLNLLFMTNCSAHRMSPSCKHAPQYHVQKRDLGWRQKLGFSCASGSESFPKVCYLLPTSPLLLDKEL